MGVKPPVRTGTYVYCIGYAEVLRAGGRPFATSGMGGPGEAVRIIEYDDLAAVVGDAPHVRYDISRENLLAHQQVVEEAMSRADVLPASFGMVAGSDMEVREKLLAAQFDELHQALQYTRGRVQLGLTVLWDREHLFQEIVAENETVRALRDATVGEAPEATYYDRIELGELTEAALEAKREEEAQAILEALEPLAADVVLNSNVTDVMVLSAAFLVDRDRVPAFDAQVEAIGEAHAGRLILRYLGPLPPYSFVDVAVRWED